MNTTLPRSATWVTLNDLPVETTPEEFQAFLAEAGLQLPIENLVVNYHRTRAQGIAALRNADVADLVERALHGMKINGQEPTVVHRRIGS